MKWEKVKLKDIAAPIKYPIGDGDHGSIKPSQYVKEGVPYIRVADISWNGDIVEKNMAFISEQLNNANAKSKLYPNDIIISKTGATIGKVAIIPDRYEVANTTASIGKVTIDKTKAYVRYVFWAMKEKEFQRQMWAVSIKSAQPGFNVIDLKNFEIYLPPLPIQRKIAAILDIAGELHRKDKKIRAMYDELQQAVFHDLFGDPAKNDKGWETGTIRDIASEVKYGTSKPAEDSGLYPYLRMNNITYSGDWDFTSMKYINLTDGERDKYLVKKGDLVFNRTNSRELVGKTAVYDCDEEMAIAGYLIRVRTNERAHPSYISSYLNSKHGKKTLMEMCKSIIGMANINAQELQEIKIMIPPIDLQNKFASIYKEIQHQKSQIIQQQIYSENLFQSLMQRAFKGELVE